MKFIIGLGNPGKEYQGTRHNVGFDALDFLAKQERLTFKRSDMPAMVAAGTVEREQVLLVKPLTYVNNSGEILGHLGQDLMQKGQLLVVCDDINLPLGCIRLRKSGSDGGHKGLRSIISHIGQSFHRLRIGIGPPGSSCSNHVLSHFKPQERELIDWRLQDVSDAIRVWIRDGIDVCMNRFNRRRKQNA
jgi:PTH1 family peptidyl-tRNA hydrolase